MFGRGVQNVRAKQEKKQTRKAGDEEEESGRQPHRQAHPDPDGQSSGQRVLGISSEARAAADALGSRSTRARQVRRANLFNTRSEEGEVPPPQYDAAAPRLPNYDTAVTGPEGGTSLGGGESSDQHPY